MAAPVDLSGSLKNKVSRIRVSSVLNKDVKQFGKQHLLDGDEETCWNSDQGSNQWVILDFSEDVQVSEIWIQFQGGFVGKVCSLEKQDSSLNTFVHVYTFYPSDSGQTQIFKLPEPVKMSTLKITFEQSTDLFGRITVYNLDIIGRSS
ncbi:nuclear receptor 2C2-associated protein [Biomphalaria glabrata]|nr:nuclear receptor 2C2-associated protein-like [Biomphalaria glabrata]